MARAFRLYFAGAILAVLTYFVGSLRDISVFQLVQQDLIVLALMTALLGLLLRWQPAMAWPLEAGQEPAFAVTSAAFVLIAGYIGASVVALHFPLSLDEFMVSFDAEIFRGGHVFAPVALEWLGLKTALQPMFMFETTAPVWASSYLPVNAALHAAMSVIDSDLTAPLLAAFSVVVLFDIARRIWPQRPDAAVVAVLLLITSSQFILTAMTPYAMTAHLALNLVWLWLFLRNTNAAHGGALIVGFAATGLHQLVFHPLFVAPFILSLWLGRRWQLAALYTVGYAVIVLFWVSWRDLLVADVPAGNAENVSAFVAVAGSLLKVDLASLVYMPRNLVRVIAWQNPFALVLFVIACANLRRWAFPLPQLLAGIVLTLLIVFILVPYQGHGWGYRYLHGLLGSFSLIAAFAWVQFTGAEAARMRGALIVCSVFALAMLPLRAWQMRSFTEPYARAAAAIKSTDADFVLIDPGDIWFGSDFVRNDPYLRDRPKVLLLNYLKEAELARLCTGHKIAVFDIAAARRYGVPTLNRKYPNVEKLRALMAQGGCGTPLGTVQ
jgi:hypothetical protein